MKRKDGNNTITVGFFSLGCAKNLVDSQVMAGVLLKNNMKLASPEKADIIIVNTCAFIEDAREESMEGIRSACSLKKTGSCRAVLVAGCMAQRYKDELRKSLPDVDGFIGLNELDRVAEIAGKLASGSRDILEISRDANRLFEPALPGLVLTGAPYAYLKIAEGCNHHCAFCAIPAIRGKHRSRTAPAIVKEAEHLLANGIKELNLISQDITAYGRDLKSGMNLARLIRLISDIGGNFWIRLLYGYPSSITDELISAMAETPQVCPYIDVPVQHSHPAVLKAMGRADSVKHVREMAGRLRVAIPGIALRTTCLVGFPGETEEHFQHLLEFVKETEFDHLGVFVYSPEKDTPAFDMADRPERRTAEKRRKRIMMAQKEIVDRKIRKLIGTEAVILVERPGAGRSQKQAPEVDSEIIVRTVRKEDIGKFISVKYISQAGYDINAVPVKTGR